MADGDGVAGNEWYRDRARMEYNGRFNFGPLATTAPGLIEAGASITLFPSASSSDMTQAAVLPELHTQSADIPMPSPSTSRLDIITLDSTDPKRVEPNSDLTINTSFPITSSIPSSTNLPSSNPSIICFEDPSLVPVSFPRDPVPQGVLQ